MASPLVYKKQIPLVVPYKGKAFAPPRTVLDVEVPLGEDDGSKSAARYMKLFKGFFEHNLQKLVTGPMLKRIAAEMTTREKQLAEEAKKVGGDSKKLKEKIEKDLNKKLAVELNKLKGGELEKFIYKVRDKCQREIVSEAKGFVFEKKANAVLKVALGSTIAMTSAGIGIVVGVATMGAGAPAAVAFGLSTVGALAGTAKTMYGLVSKQVKEYNKYQVKVEKHIKDIGKLELELQKQQRKEIKGVKRSPKDKAKLVMKMCKGNVKKLRNDLDGMEKYHIVLQGSVAKQTANIAKMQEKLADTKKKVAGMEKSKAKTSAEKVVNQLEGRIIDMEYNLVDVASGFGAFNDLHNKATKAIATLESVGEFKFAAAGTAAKVAVAAAQKSEGAASKGLEQATNAVKLVDVFTG